MKRLHLYVKRLSELWNSCYERLYAKQNQIEVEKPEQWPLNQPVLDFGGDYLTIGATFEGIFICGATGSGKSTGSYASSTLGMLRYGYGGVFCTCKPSDRDQYLALCEAAGRSKDVIIFNGDNRYYYCPFKDELSRRDKVGAISHNISSMILNLLEVSERSSKSTGGDADYFKRAMRQLLVMAIDLCLLSDGKISISRIYSIVTSLPTSLEQTRSKEWQRHSVCYQLLQEADGKTLDRSRKLDFALVADFILTEWPQLADRTRTSTLSTLTSLLDTLNRGFIRDSMNPPGRHLSPELTHEGKIIILDFPSMVYGDAGLYLQILFKYGLQKTQERRIVNGSSRPVFLAIDESQKFLVKQDQEFQQIARATRTAVVLATQSVSTYIAAFGANCEAEVHSILGNLQTHIYHQQVDTKTVQYVAELVGRSPRFLMNANCSHQQTNWLTAMFGQLEGQASGGVSETLEYEITPSMMSDLRKGGHPKYLVDAIIYQGGKRFKTSGKPWRHVTFNQFISSKRARKPI